MSSFFSSRMLRTDSRQFWCWEGNGVWETKSDHWSLDFWLCKIYQWRTHVLLSNMLQHFLPAILLYYCVCSFRAIVWRFRQRYTECFENDFFSWFFYLFGVGLRVKKTMTAVLWNWVRIFWKQKIQFNLTLRHRAFLLTCAGFTTILVSAEISSPYIIPSELGSLCLRRGKVRPSARAISDLTQISAFHCSSSSTNRENKVSFRF